MSRYSGQFGRPRRPILLPRHRTMTQKRLAALLLIATTLPLVAWANLPDCTSGARFAAAQAQIDAALKTVGDAPARNRARLEAQLKASAAARGWSKEQQDELIRKAYHSPGYMELEKQKQPHVSALMQAVLASSGPEPKVSKCAAAKEVRASAWAVADIHKRQYVHAAREVGLSTEARAR